MLNYINKMEMYAVSEQIDILNDMGLKTGKVAAADDVHSNGYWHRVVKVLVLNKMNQLLVQRRSETKKIFPNVWDVAVTGHVAAEELPLNSAKREIFEELGFDFDKNDINYLFSYKKNIGYNEFKERIFIDLFYIKSDINLENISISNDEVDEVKFINIDEAIEVINDDYFIEKEELNNIINCLKGICYDN